MQSHNQPSSGAGNPVMSLIADVFMGTKCMGTRAKVWYAAENRFFLEPRQLPDGHFFFLRARMIILAPK